MSSPASVTMTFASILAAQAEATGATRIEATGDTAVAPGLGRLLATIDPTRSAFASALNHIDVTNAPKVSGPYVPGAASGPLTEDDIFDPSRLYSLPGKELVIFDGDTVSRVKTANAEIMRLADRDTQAPRAADNLDTNPTKAFESDDDRRVAMPPAARNVVPDARRPTDIMPAGLDGGQPPLALELAVAGCLSLLKSALTPMKRKASRRLAADDDSEHAYAARSRDDGQSKAKANEKGDDTALF